MARFSIGVIVVGLAAVVFLVVPLVALALFAYSQLGGPGEAEVVATTEASPEDHQLDDVRCQWHERRGVGVTARGRLTNRTDGDRPFVIVVDVTVDGVTRTARWPVASLGPGQTEAWTVDRPVPATLADEPRDPAFDCRVTVLDAEVRGGG
jgi:hypothetical protein